MNKKKSEFKIYIMHILIIYRVIPNLFDYILTDKKSLSPTPLKYVIFII